MVDVAFIHDNREPSPSVKEIQNQTIRGVSGLVAFRATLRMISALIIHMSNRFLHFLI